jgi:chaperone required for assembly of F1-ATPase
MANLFEDVFAAEPVDPVGAARRAIRPSLRKRFYGTATVGETDGGFALLLDGKGVHTPARRGLAAPVRILAQALADEWEAQRELIDPARMPLTRLANSIIDGVANAPEPVAAEISKYLGTDLLFYRAAEPARLVARQAQHWDPILAWARDALGARFTLVEGIGFIAQPQAALDLACAAIPGHASAKDIWRLGAVNAITTLTGSALIALALSRRVLPIDAAWAAAHVDEDWNMEQWGGDEIALERRAYREGELRAAVTVLGALPEQDRAA